MKEGQPQLNRAVIRWGKHFSNQTVRITDKFYADFNIGESLHLNPQQDRVFLAYFAYYWVLKSNLDAARLSRNPMYEQMAKMPVLKGIAKSVYYKNDGVNLAGQIFLELAQKYAAKLEDKSHWNIRNAANILSSIFLEGEAESDELNQKMDRALSRLKIGKNASPASQMV